MIFISCLAISTFLLLVGYMGGLTRSKKSLHEKIIKAFEDGGKMWRSVAEDRLNEVHTLAQHLNAQIEANGRLMSAIALYEKIKADRAARRHKVRGASGKFVPKNYRVRL